MTRPTNEERMHPDSVGGQSSARRFSDDGAHRSDAPYPRRSLKPIQHFVVSFRSIMKMIVKVLAGLSLSR